MRETNINVESLNRGAKCNECEETTYAGTEMCPNCGSEDMDTEWNSLLSNYSLHDVGEAYFTGRINQIGLEVEQWGIDKRHDDDTLIFDNKMDLRLWEPLSGVDKSMEWPNVPTTDTYTETTFELPEKESETHDIDNTVLNEWQLRGVADIKTKSNQDWLGKFNLRHLAHYAEHAEYYADLDVPTFLYFTMVDREAERVGEKNILVEVPHDWDWKPLVDHYDPDDVTDLTYGECKDFARTCPIVHRTFRAPDGNLVVSVDEDHYENFDYVTEKVL